MFTKYALVLGVFCSVPRSGSVSEGQSPRVSHSTVEAPNLDIRVCDYFLIMMIRTLWVAHSSESVRTIASSSSLDGHAESAGLPLGDTSSSNAAVSDTAK